MAESTHLKEGVSFDFVALVHQTVAVPRNRLSQILHRAAQHNKKPASHDMFPDSGFGQ